MASTSNFGFELAEQSDYVSDFVENYNANLKKMDAMPLPMASGNNTQLNYQKFADGTLHVWGMIDYGTKYPCKTQVATASGFSSDQVTVNFPVAFSGFSGSSYCLITYVSADKNPDMTFATKSQGTSSIVGNFICPLNDSASPNSKKLNVEAWGRWK